MSATIKEEKLQLCHELPIILSRLGCFVLFVLLEILEFFCTCGSFYCVCVCVCVHVSGAKQPEVS